MPDFHEVRFPLDVARGARGGPERQTQIVTVSYTHLDVYKRQGEVEARDWSTGSDRGCEQEFALVVWAARSGSSRQALEAAGLIVTALDQVDLTLDGHALVNLRWLSSRLARETRNGLPQVTIRFRAAIETL